VMLHTVDFGRPFGKLGLGTSRITRLIRPWTGLPKKNRRRLHIRQRLLAVSLAASGAARWASSSQHLKFNFHSRSTIYFLYAVTECVIYIQILIWKISEIKETKLGNDFLADRILWWIEATDIEWPVIDSITTTCRNNNPAKTDTI
jgi:hypothetical protein